MGQQLRRKFSVHGVPQSARRVNNCGEIVAFATHASSARWGCSNNNVNKCIGCTGWTQLPTLVSYHAMIRQH
eukprot:1577416-Amphidinium_carterae.2